MTYNITLRFLNIILCAVILFSILFLLDIDSVRAQTKTIYDGITPSGIAPGAPIDSYSLSDIEDVNLYNGGLNIKIPLAGLKSRGLSYSFIKSFQSNLLWSVQREYYTEHESTLYYEKPIYHHTVFSNRYYPGYLSINKINDPVLPTTCNPNDPATMAWDTLTTFTFMEADGTEHVLYDTAYGGGSYHHYCLTPGRNRGRVFTTSDGGAFTFIADNDIYDIGPYAPTSGNLMLKDGTQYRIDDGKVTQIRDSNGNIIRFTYQTSNYITDLVSISDSMNRSISISYSNGTVPYDAITYKGFGGAVRVVKVWYGVDAFVPGESSKTLGQLFPNILYRPGDADQDAGSLVISKIELPNGKSYQFFYNSYNELARVILPTGGGYDYEYSPTVRAGMMLYRRLSKRTIFKSLTPETPYLNPPADQISAKVYYNSVSSQYNLAPSRTIVTVQYKDTSEVLLAQEVHEFYGEATDNNEGCGATWPLWYEGREYKVDRYNVISGNLGGVVERIEHTFSPSPTNTNNTYCQLQPTLNPQITQSVKSLPEVGLVSKNAYTYDQYGNQTGLWEYGYGTNASGPLLRHTQTTYLTGNPNQGNVDYAADFNIHIRNLPADVAVFDGNGKKVSETSYAYDAYGTSGFPGLQDCPLIVQHDPAFHHNYGTRGNLVQVSKVVSFAADSTPTASINNKFQYDLAGNMVKKIDARGKETSIDYTDRFGAPDGDARSNNGAPELGGQFGYAYPTVAVDPMGLVTYTQYDYYTGKPVDVEDPNNFTSSFYYEDALDRPTKGIKAVGSGAAAQTLYIYNDSDTADGENPAHSITTISDQMTLGESDGGTGLKSLMLYDGLGRTLRSVVYEGDSWLATDTRYDALGRVSQVSNPFRLSSPEGATATSEWTTTEYDGLSRVIKMTTPDGAHMDTAYAGNQVTVTDQAGKKRRSEADALGRLTAVTEDPGGLNYQTAYLYDALGNLRFINQGGQGRWFAYDALSRLIRSRNPEQNINSSLPAYTDPLTGGNGWSTAYSYDANGNLVSKTDARNITTTYTYDANNRNTKIDYSSYANGSSVVERYYDGATNGKGRSWYEIAYNKRWEKETDNLAYQQSKVDAYDAVGRPNSLTQSFQLVDGSYKTFSFRRTYDLAGNVISQSYPSSHGARYAYDGAGRLKSFSGGLGDFVNRTYVSDVRYNGYGMVSREAYGTQTPLYLNLHYNNRQQLVDLRLGTNEDDENDWSRGALSYYYGTNAKNDGDPFANSVDNNGNVLRQVNTVPLASGGQVIPQMDDYNYDPLNRITSVSEQQQNQDGTRSTIFSQGFSYDRWGNRTINLGATTIGIPGVTRQNFLVDTGSNRLTSVDGLGMTYDAAGNQTNDGNGDRYYDNENRMTKAVQGGQTHYYYYDANGKRVRRILNGAETWFVYGFDGELLEEYTYNQVSPPTSTVPVKEYGYRNGKLLVVWDGAQSGDKTLKWLVTDHLGSTRMEVDRSGSLAGVARIDYLPFGEELGSGVGIRSANIGYSGDSVRQKFERQERDNETGLDYFGARYYSSTHGRFTSPDVLILSAALEYPQSWNRYAFARNNPLEYIDQEGLFPNPAYKCDNNHSSCLNDEQRRILENSKINVGGKDLSGQALYEAIGQQKNGEAVLNAFVNLTDRLASVQFNNGTNALSQVNSISGFAPDRIYANVNQSLINELQNSMDFTSVNAGLHGDYNAASFKDTGVMLGNIQFSFNKTHEGADIDIDIGNIAAKNPLKKAVGGIIHAEEVLQNSISGTKTNQDIVRRLLINNPKIQTITPSPDPTFNRK